MSNAGWCCNYEDGNGLWYTDEYPEEVFFDHWFWMAERYRHNPLVIGADLRNEIRGILGSTKKLTVLRYDYGPNSGKNPKNCNWSLSIRKKT